MKGPLIVIEHLEEGLSNWLALEYENAARIARGRLAITRCVGRVRDLAKRLGVACYEESVVELEGFLYSRCDRLVILDPRAGKLFEPEEARSVDAVAVGGILGDHPPRGRTRTLLTSRKPCALARSLGPHQFAIDGAVYMALQVIGGRRVEEVPVTVGLRFSIRDPYGFEYEVELPYAYPLIGSRPLYHPKLPELLRSGLAYEEYRLLGEGDELAKEYESDTPGG